MKNNPPHQCSKVCYRQSEYYFFANLRGEALKKYAWAAGGVLACPPALDSERKQSKKIPKSNECVCMGKTGEQKDLVCTPNHLPTSICMVSAGATLAF